MGSLNINGFDTSDGSLTFRENNGSNLPVTRSEVITWVVPANLGITINGIRKYTDSQDIFDPEHEPNPVGGGSKNWQGTISGSAANNAEEEYYIDWYEDSAPSTIYPFDPKLTVSSA